jgi:hypothetical protein
MASKMYSRDYNVIQSGGNPALISLLPALAPVAMSLIEPILKPVLGSLFGGPRRGNGLNMAGAGLKLSGQGRRVRRGQSGDGKIGQWFKDTF